MGFAEVALATAAGGAINVVAAQLPPVAPNASAAVRVAAVLLCATSLAIPFVYEAPAGILSFQAAVIAIVLGRVIEIARTPERFGRGERAVRVLLLFDTTLMKRAPRRVPLAAFALGLPLTALGVFLLMRGAALAPPATPYAREGWLRWLGAAPGAYLLVEGTSLWWTALPRLVGFEHAPLQRSPIRARSLAEFWGVRWNRLISHWLRSNVFAPLARRGAPRAGLMASFLVSALLHFFMVLPACGLAPALWMGAFFALHGALALVESRLPVRRLRPAIAHTLVAAVFVATLPLFAEPFLRAFGL